MKIVHIVPGSGGTFYCQNCMRDLGLVKALRKIGHDVIIAPMYLPVELNDPTIENQSPLFYGAVKVYLQQTSPLFRRAPDWLNSMLDSKTLLNMAAKRSGSTDAPGLAELTLSTLAGEHGIQANDLNKLTTWLKTDIQPEVINLSNALLLGLAGQLKKETGARIYCTLQDEDVWVDAMDSKSAAAIWKVMSEKVEFIDGFSTVSHYYADFMSSRLKIPQDKITVIYPGTDFAGYAPPETTPHPPVLGFLSRMSGELGLDILTDAWIRIRKNKKINDLKLHVTGGSTTSDRSFLAQIKKSISRTGLTQDAVFFDNFDRNNRIAFLQGLTLLSVPVPTGEAFGSYIIEALACGVPSVQPRAGAFPEIAEATGGGIIYDADNADSLAAAIEKLLLDRQQLNQLGITGRRRVLELFSSDHIAAQTAEFYSRS